jgi:hypothetical protein
MVITRNDPQAKANAVRITPKFMTKYERARIIGKDFRIQNSIFQNRIWGENLKPFTQILHLTIPIKSEHSP